MDPILLCITVRKGREGGIIGNLDNDKPQRCETKIHTSKQNLSPIKQNDKHETPVILNIEITKQTQSPAKVTLKCTERIADNMTTDRREEDEKPCHNHK